MATYPLPFGDGRNLGLAPDAFFQASLASPGILFTPLAADGTGATGSFLMPLAPQTVLYAATVSFSLAPFVSLEEVTDAVEIIVQ